MINQRNKGHNYERTIRKELRERFYPDCETSRFESKKADDSGVDFVNSGFLQIQAKSWERAPAYHDVLARMPQNEKYNVIFHRKKHKGDVVVMTKEDFYELLEIMKFNNIKI